MRRHYNWGRDRSDKSGAAPSHPEDGRGANPADLLPLRYEYSDENEQRDVVLNRTEVRIRRALEARMTMTMTVPNDSYLGVALRRGWDGDAPVLVHRDASLSLPLPGLYGVPADRQAEAWADELGVPCLVETRRAAPRRLGNPLNGRQARKTARRRYARPAEARRVEGAELCAPA